MAHTRRIMLDMHDSSRGSLQLGGIPRHRRIARDLAFLIVRIAFIALLGTLAYSIGASAADNPGRSLQSLQSVRNAAEQLVRDAAPDSQRDSSKLIVTVAEPDPRLQLVDCGTELRAFTLNGAAIGARNTIGVRCADETAGAWTVYLSVAVEVERSVLVLRHSLSRDAHVADDDVEVQLKRVPGIGAAYPSDLAAIRDQHLKRGTPAGTVLSGDLLARDFLVKRGQEVSLVFGAEGLAVRAPGLALADGGLSDRIRVQNRTSLKVVEGTIESGNLVRVGL
jgi:flagella basal body P-ring formation protein FlgA